MLVPKPEEGAVLLPNPVVFEPKAEGVEPKAEVVELEPKAEGVELEPKPVEPKAD